MTQQSVEDDKLREILAGCEGVTPGPWVVYHDTCAQCEKNGTAEYGISGLPGGYHAPFGKKADAAHIAACDPQTITSIITELLASRSKLKAVEPLDHDELLGITEYLMMQADIDTPDAADPPCEDLCGSRVCEAVGCVVDKFRRVRHMPPPSPPSPENSNG